MVNTAVTLCGLPLENPVIPASGTFGYGYEFAQIYDINCLGTFSFKGRRSPPVRKPHPRIAEYAGGLLNSVGLQNPGVEAVIREELPRLREVFPQAGNGQRQRLFRGGIRPSMPAAGRGGAGRLAGGKHLLPQRPRRRSALAQTRTAAAVTRAVRDVTKKPVIMKLSPAVGGYRCRGTACQEAGPTVSALSILCRGCGSI